MAADDDTETEVFEITDFTTASEWERFVSRLEEVLNDWKLIGNAPRKTPPAKGEFTSGVWNEKTEEINFADFKFCITHHFLEQEAESESRETQKDEDAFPVAMQDLLCMNNDFPPRAHCLVRWFGLRSFVVVSPGANCEAVISESKCNLLLSSVSIALQNSGCQAPVLMQVQQKWRRLFTGECQGPGVRVDFEMVHLHKVPTHYKNLSGLLDIFKNKIGCTLSPLPPINISIRFTYILQDWQQCTWPQQPPDFDGLFGGEVGGVEFGKVPFGACAEPISELHLAATWPHLTEGIIVDNDVYSELDPLQAPHWSVRIRTVDNAQCLLGDFLMEFFRLTLCSESLDEILGRSLTEEEGGRDHADISSALQKLTQPSASVHISKLSVSHMVHSARRHMRRRRYEESPLSNQSLNTALLFLFPDAAVEKTPEKSSPHSDESQERDADSTEYLHLKAAPLDSLTHRLALCLASVNHSQGGLRAVAHLWQEFVLELRYRWENNYLIHGLPSGPPDLRCCLLHQKLQMLNCCIERKRSRDEAHRGQSSGGTPPSTSVKKAETDKDAAPTTSWESWSDSEDEFYECVSDLSESNNSERKPEGRLKQHRDMRLLHTHQPLYIPVTQEPSPLTEDMLEQQSEVLSKLGTSAEGAHLRARMQSACLLSDMEAFKAANPGCVLEDFVRWYSPRDYISEEHPDEGEVRGGLSARMRIPGNMWLEAWDSAKATPARRQRRLFDDTTEAEKVLHHLSLLKPSELVLQLLPSLILSALGKLREEEASEDLPSVKTALDQASVQAGRLLHQSKPDLQQLEEFLLNLMSLETSITRARSLKAKFGVSPQSESEHHEQLLQFVSALLEEPEVEVTGAGQGPAGSIIHQLFISAQRAALLSPLDPEAGPGSDPDSRSSEQVPDFPPPTGREMILRTCVPSPACYSRALPQRMFCVILKDEFRLAAALSHDTAFF
ncbi:rab3 GTPase-activating protein catalytic subunit [Periophthalmus magnuspinnatus]|uniref:rab3 GTPase-activating protein catalytic subunit n=1 Tax=Periophthalmus magnuspinnatus TaxID=409849 RepID=UPI00145AEEA9|nr:rab3 GTPase-activating protein catalytic subunit [Periophthalmus magnuspinnatus]